MTGTAFTAFEFRVALLALGVPPPRYHVQGIGSKRPKPLDPGALMADLEFRTAAYEWLSERHGAIVEHGSFVSTWIDQYRDWYAAQERALHSV
jgi:hypothetical protein